ncbi:MAG: DUF1294 domain-containing protein [Clostridia bacterium]|nr:DUF1294 domain-containing protein [Clostridia bacterium]
MILLAALAVTTVMNLAAFALMGHDKRRARQGKRRVPEKTLFLVAACFGGLGGVLGMQVFRHKTKHWYFKVFFPAFMVVQLALLAGGALLLFRP